MISVSRAALCVLLLLHAGCSREDQPTHAASTKPAREIAAVKIDPYFDSKFWAIWGDDKAELNLYKLTRRSGERLIQGTARAIFVVERFSNSARVRVEPGKRGAGDEFPVMTLNLIKRDNEPSARSTMLSSFVSLAPVNRRPAATASKVAFSSQDSAGQLYGQLLFGENRVQFLHHSYRDGEADQRGELDYQPHGFSEDTLYHWARAMARPFPGNDGEYLLLSSLESARMNQVPLTFGYQRLLKDKAPKTISVPMGTFEVDVLRLKRRDGAWRAFYSERVMPRRIIKWETSDGETAELISSGRIKP